MSQVQNCYWVNSSSLYDSRNLCSKKDSFFEHLYGGFNTYDLNPECKRNSSFTNQLYIELGRKSSPMLRTQFRTSILFAVHFSVLSTENADLKSTYLVINESTITIQYCSALVFRINHSKRLFFFQDFFPAFIIYRVSHSKEW